MFGIGGQELVVVGILFLLLFGPAKTGEVARDLGRFISKARASVEEFKSELAMVEEGDQQSTSLPKYKKP